jgi:hypothetical protein
MPLSFFVDLCGEEPGRCRYEVFFLDFSLLSRAFGTPKKISKSSLTKYTTREISVDPLPSHIEINTNFDIRSAIMKDMSMFSTSSDGGSSRSLPIFDVRSGNMLLPGSVRPRMSREEVMDILDQALAIAQGRNPSFPYSESPSKKQSEATQR